MTQAISCELEAQAKSEQADVNDCDEGGQRQDDISYTAKMPLLCFSYATSMSSWPLLFGLWSDRASDLDLNIMCVCIYDASLYNRIVVVIRVVPRERVAKLYNTVTQACVFTCFVRGVSQIAAFQLCLLRDVRVLMWTPHIQVVSGEALK